MNSTVGKEVDGRSGDGVSCKVMRFFRWLKYVEIRNHNIRGWSSTQ